ncbi:MAG: hypothetical protein PHT07_07605 [Paludibacter sp.]|nr:hypothetical protein [Paludibacter sp.]
MDYREHLFRPLTLHFVDALVQEVFQNPSDKELVFQLIFDPEIKVAWRAAWACQKISEKYPEWFTDSQFKELAALAISTTHGGLQRGCLSILNNLPIPEDISVEFINACFDWMVSPKSPIAVQALSMKMLYRICLMIPDFKPELIAYLENIAPGDYSAGFNSTRRNVLNLLINN